MAQSIRTSLILVLLLLLPAGYAHPLGLTVDYAINFFSPNPCNETFVGGNSLEGYTLNGGINLFLGNATRTDAIASTGVADLACGSSLRLPAVQIPDLNVTERIPLSLQFGGNLTPSPGPPDLPLFAFASPGTQIGTLTVQVTAVPEPGTLLLLGTGLAGMAVCVWRRRRTA